MEPTLNKWENAQQDLVFADFVLSADLSINRQAVLSSCRNCLLYTSDAADE